jgi:hypothetical protein
MSRQDIMKFRRLIRDIAVPDTEAALGIDVSGP